MKSFALITNEDFDEQIGTLVQTECEVVADIIEHIKEAERRGLNRVFGYSSLFAYLTERFGYTAGSAQRRIDAARLAQEIPELLADIAFGSINLMQVSILAQGVRQKKKESPKSTTTTAQKRELIEDIKHQSLASTQKIVAQRLDIKPKTQEKQSVQQDESVRIELTLTKQQMARMNRVKDLISHKHPGMSVADLLDYLAEDFLKRKDPLRKPAQAHTQTKEADPTSSPNISQAASEEAAPPDSKVEVLDELLSKSAEDKRSTSITKPTRRISAETRRWVFQKYLVCQWRDPKTNRLCGSQFQLQIDHIKPIWAGGGDERENLHVLCSFHNRQKYRDESQIKRV